ncbi:EF-hand domain-containing protein [Thalassobaculum fulvum]|nr:EF-hand domain-containing protein [Thalassobaculum fulvum]
MTRSKLTLATALVLAAAAGTTAALAHGPDGMKPGGMMMPGGDHRARMEQRFQEMDADKDGKVTAAEMQAARAARFAAIDANGDGKLSVEEMDDARKAQRLERLQRMVVWLDADGDGMLSAAEYDPRKGRMMARMDDNGDGAVSMEEMRDAGKRFHHRSGGQEGGARMGGGRMGDCPMGGPKN